jgi:SAM-dependent methyltransferase
MSGFSPEWLSLREPVDHRSRNKELLAHLAAHLERASEPTIVDIGCGTGSNLRGTAPSLGRRQRWILVDYDPRLLEAAARALARWGDTAIRDDAGLVLMRGPQTITVTFRQADLAADLTSALAGDVDLVTASAFFDLTSAAFIERFAGEVAAQRAAFYTVLTYDGTKTWTPRHPADHDMSAAFNAHQGSDKGFGPAAGPRAATLLRAAFTRAGYAVEETPSPWQLGERDRDLIAALAGGFADAVAETGRVSRETIAAWRQFVRTGASVGHIDTLALPQS